MCECIICNISYPEINEGIDFIRFQNWEDEVVTICRSCLDVLKEQFI